MQTVSVNALILFDAIFVFFLFLVSVSCLLYYLPLVPSSSFTRRRAHERIITMSVKMGPNTLDSIESNCPLRGGSGDEESLFSRSDMPEFEIEIETSPLQPSSASASHAGLLGGPSSSSSSPLCDPKSHIIASDFNTKSPIQTV